MKKIIILLVILLLSSCDSIYVHRDGWAEPINSNDEKLDVTIYEFNGHQYLIFGRDFLTSGVVHNPDCPCITKYN